MVLEIMGKINEMGELEVDLPLGLPSGMVRIRLDIPEVAPVRVAGLHAGTTWVSDDFDDPLPDELIGFHS